MRREDALGSHQASRAHEMTPESVPSPGGTLWGLTAFFALVGLVATALVASDLRERWAERART